MNTTEALFHLERIEEAFRADHLDTEADAVRMAIEVLEQQDKHRKSWEGIVDGNAR